MLFAKLTELITDSSTAASMVKATTEMPSWFISSIWSFMILLNGDATNTTSSGNNGASVPNFPYSPLQNP